MPVIQPFRLDSARADYRDGVHRFDLSGYLAAYQLGHIP
jgi:hypothetical protein